MYFLSLPSVIIISELIFVSIDCLKIKSLKLLCDSLKPNGVFNGVEVIEKFGHKRGELWMYANQKEWMFHIKRHSIILMEETIKTIERKPETKLKFLSKDFISFELKGMSNIGSDAIPCFINSWDSCQVCDKKTLFESMVLRKELDVTSETNWFVILDKTSQSNHLIYLESTGQLLDLNFCQKILGKNCNIPSFLSDIPKHWIHKLDAIIDLSNHLNRVQKSWLLLFNNNSKPLFCIVDKTQNFTEGCKNENIKEYGFECNDVLKVKVTTINRNNCQQTYYEWIGMEWIALIFVLWIFLFALVAGNCSDI